MEIDTARAVAYFLSDRLMLTQVSGPLYGRSRDGHTIHKQSCFYYRRSLPWKFADNMSEDWVKAAASAYSWLRLCHRCWKENA